MWIVIYGKVIFFNLLFVSDAVLSRKCLRVVINVNLICLFLFAMIQVLISDPEIHFVNDFRAIKVDYMIMVPCMFRSAITTFMLFHVSNMFSFLLFFEIYLFPHVIPSAIRCILHDVVSFSSVGGLCFTEGNSRYMVLKVLCRLILYYAF